MWTSKMESLVRLVKQEELPSSRMWERSPVARGELLLRSTFTREAQLLLLYTWKQSDRPTEPQNEGLEFQTEEHPVPRMSENGQGNGSGLLVDVQSLSRQLAQVLSNPEDEAAQELITLMRRVVIPPSTIDVDANGVVHEQVRYSDMPKQAPPQVYSNPAFESNVYVHGRPVMESNTFRPTVRPTSFYQNIPSAYEVGNSSGNGQNGYLNSGQTIQHGFTRTHVDLIQKGLLQYAKGEKDPMSIESDPFPKVEINMVNANLAKRLGSTVVRQKQGEGDRMETDEESAKSQPLRFPNDYLCIRCGREIKYGEAIIAEKEQKCAFSKSGLRFNTMGGNDLQIYVGAKLIYEGIDPGLFNRIESEHCYGPDDGPFLFRGHPVVPARPGVPSSQELEAVGYQFPSRGRYSNYRGAGPRRGIGPRGRGPYGYGGHQPRMVMPPNNDHENWSTLSHPKFPAEGWYTKVSTSQKRRLQRKFAARMYNDPWDHVFEHKEKVEPHKVPNMVWTRGQEGTSSQKQNVSEHEVQDTTAASSKSVILPKGRKELKQSLKKKMEEFQKLMEADDDDLLDEESEQEDLIKDATPSPQKSATFGESLAAIQFGSVPINYQYQHPFQAETNNVEADLYKEHLWPMKIEDTEVKSNGIGVTESQFLTYIKEGFRELSKDFVRPNVIARPVVDKKLQACEPISCNWAECVFDDSPLTMKDLGLADLKPAPAKLDDDRAQVKDPTEEVNLGTQEDPKITFG
ncbi:hypothetical protein RHSIM_Rhsim01G0057100 [Rhododendron simsii]|uniref:Uncharacterized protein n=1 Tax=Rhododendron simsii TaxID=118357 RepID=A0A834HEC2_RHOSS|nr:hypothetical protein RHSIM_Rhsim01G0057100 [Rhododendron simsii]